MGKIVVIGSSNTDLVIRTPRIPSPGETLIGSDFMINAGGKGANQAVAAARMGGDVCFVACVGDDGFGAEAVRHYAGEGIDTSYIVRRNGVASGVALIAVDDAAENSIVVAPGANALLSTADIDAVESEIAAADYLLVQLEIPMETVARVTELAVRYGVRVILNPAPAAPIADEVLARLDLITPNRSETELLTGLKVENVGDAVAAAAWFRGRGVRRVAVTMGSAGHWWPMSGARSSFRPIVSRLSIRRLPEMSSTARWPSPSPKGASWELQHVSPPPRLQSPVPASAPSVPFRSGAK